jgi:uncharacterized protein YukE
MDTNTETDKAISQLSQSLAGAAESQRALLSEMTLYAKDEAQRFANLRMERNSHALEKLSTCTGLPGMIELQHEWLRDLMQDYAGQNMRLVGTWRGVAHTVVSEATEAVGETVERMQSGAADMARTTEEAASHAEDLGQQAVQDVGEQMADLGHDMNNNYVQH